MVKSWRTPRADRAVYVKEQQPKKDGKQLKRKHTSRVSEIKKYIRFK